MSEFAPEEFEGTPRSIPEIAEALHGIAEARRGITDPWIRRGLGRQRRKLLAELAEAERRLKENK